MAGEPPQLVPMPPALVADQGGQQSQLRRRRRRPQGRGFAEEVADDAGDGYDPTPVERPDPNQPLIEALDRLRAVEPSPAAHQATTAVRARAVKAYEEHSSGWHRPAT